MTWGRFFERTIYCDDCGCQHTFVFDSDAGDDEGLLRMVKWHAVDGKHLCGDCYRRYLKKKDIEIAELHNAATDEMENRSSYRKFKLTMSEEKMYDSEHFPQNLTNALLSYFIGDRKINVTDCEYSAYADGRECSFTVELLPREEEQ